MWFSRISTEKDMVTNALANEVNFGVMDCSSGKMLSGLEKSLAKIMLPVLKSQEVGKLASLDAVSYGSLFYSLGVHWQQQEIPKSQTSWGR